MSGYAKIDEDLVSSEIPELVGEKSGLSQTKQLTMNCSTAK